MPVFTGVFLHLLIVIIPEQEPGDRNNKISCSMPHSFRYLGDRNKEGTNTIEYCEVPHYGHTCIQLEAAAAFLGFGLLIDIVALLHFFGLKIKIFKFIRN